MLFYAIFTGSCLHKYPLRFIEKETLFIEKHFSLEMH